MTNDQICAQLASITTRMGGIERRGDLTALAGELRTLTSQIAVALQPADERVADLESQLATLYRCVQFAPNGQPGSRFAAAIACHDDDTLTIRIPRPAGMINCPFAIAGPPAASLIDDNLVLTVDIELL